MTFSTPVTPKTALTLITIIGATLLAFACGSAVAQERERWQVGARLGFDDGRNDEDFNQAEVFVARRVPLSISGSGHLALAVSLAGSAGILSAAGSQGVVGALGPGLTAGLWGGRVELKAGICPTIISEDKFGDEDLGGPVQFTSHAGLALRYKRMSLGYRFQHMSNAGLYSRNPGLNLHVIEFGWWF